ncbi:hypothetical protein DB346_15335 [Verrucomicrobia bacterium LW23]|nr:hypothetical protein DB346_15335 [Verrucomicrobia bacterium LW23]
MVVVTRWSGFFAGGKNYLAPGMLCPDRYFWMVAHRRVPLIKADPWGLPPAGVQLPGGDLAEGYARVNHLYNGFMARMVRPRLQRGGTHVVWLDADGKESVVWAFADVEIPADGLVDAESNAAAGTMLRKGRVYLAT